MIYAKHSLKQAFSKGWLCYCYFCKLGREPLRGPDAHLKGFGHMQPEPGHLGAPAGETVSPGSAGPTGMATGHRWLRSPGAVCSRNGDVL